jgi:hypothetical protein
MAIEDFNIKINIESYQAKLVSYLEQRMRNVCARLVGYVIDHFGPSNQKGENPSKPGDTPNVGIGILRNNIAFVVKREGQDVVGEFGVRRGPANFYARRLELGFIGRDKSGRNVTQLPRPFLRPAYHKNKKLIVKILSS